ncbi:MAG: zf-HC2 domain-containing protein [Candidatus Omnitrophica bacterium]|nr:zf-HC2 domain-containing protein [Candidatus Omnitrophota bacterium]
MGMCYFFRKKLLDFAEGRLPEREAQRLASHLDGCPVCRRELGDIRRGLEASGLYRPHEEGEVFWKKFDADLWSKIYERSAHRLPGAARRFILTPLWKPALAVLPLLVILFAVVMRTAPVLQLSRWMPESYQEAAVVRDAAWLVEEASDEQALAAADEDITTEIETLYLLDPSAIQGIG